MTTKTLTAPREGGRSPWGTINSVETLDAENGAWFVSTPGHGGVKLSAALNAKIPAPLRCKGGWYEEDCEWAIPGYFLPQTLRGAPATVTAEVCAKTIKNYFPKGWAATGRAVTVEESWALKREADEKENADKWVVISAIGDTDRTQVVTLATKGAQRGPGRQERWFLIPATEYETRTAFGFVIQDPAKYVEVDETRFRKAQFG